MALKIGETVKIREDLIAGNEYGGLRFIEPMYKYKGKITEVINSKLSIRGRIYELKGCVLYSWTEDMFDKGDWFVKECPICHSNKMVYVRSHLYEKDKLICYCQECGMGHQEKGSETIHEAKIKWNEFVTNSGKQSPSFNKGQEILLYEDKEQQHLRSMTTIAEVFPFVGEDSNCRNYYRLTGFAEVLFPEELIGIYKPETGFSLWLNGFVRLKNQEYDSGRCLFGELETCEDILKMFNLYFKKEDTDVK